MEHVHAEIHLIKRVLSSADTFFGRTFQIALYLVLFTHNGP
jgi:hypothetical protein